jgi:hypothetical protein
MYTHQQYSYIPYANITLIFHTHYSSIALKLKYYRTFLYPASIHHNISSGAGELSADAIWEKKRIKKH